MTPTEAYATNETESELLPPYLAKTPPETSFCSVSAEPRKATAKARRQRGGSALTRRMNGGTFSHHIPTASHPAAAFLYKTSSKQIKGVGSEFLTEKLPSSSEPVCYLSAETISVVLAEHKSTVSLSANLQM